MKKNVLFISYEFPPEGCRGTKRVMKFIRYLPSLGYIPTILTVKNGNYEYHDGSLLKELSPELSIYRAFSLESFFYKHDYSDTEVRDIRSDKDKLIPFSFIRKIILQIYHLFGSIFRFPDSRILWLPFAFFKGLEIIKRDKIELLFASGPSFTNHLVGILLKKITQRPLLVDFRDAWASDPARKAKNKFQKYITSKFEQSSVFNADIVISTTEGITADFIQRYGELNEKFVTITHGYDPNDFSNIKINKILHTKFPFRIVHAGTLGAERSPKNFLQALGELLTEDSELETKLEVAFVGQNTILGDSKRIEDYIKEYGVNKIVKLTGFVSKNKSLKLILNSHLLLLIIGIVPKEEAYIYGISAKIYDYLFAAKPVITISEEGATANLARQLGLGCVVNPNDKIAIKKALKRYYEAYKNGELIRHNTNKDIIQAFDYTNLSKTLAHYFSTVISNYK